MSDQLDLKAIPDEELVELYGTAAWAEEESSSDTVDFPTAADDRAEILRRMKP